ncbi:disintegrin and metalloproteinase domain-containing protein 29 [Tenrec ecaudatus]|uniref:disintegrin and metalloproteinase domain-containing protein 29 n=1 Tax=Tenrec ecaudatus TaxID=94439 RepID=UPI003F594292
MAGSKAPVNSMITLWLFRLGVFLFLSQLSQVGSPQYQTSPEVVIPLKVAVSGSSMKASDWFSYHLNFGGQRYIMHMKIKKLLVSRHLPVFTYTDQGALLEDHPFVQKDCYYHGYVEGKSESLVVLSNCLGGFHGMIQINDFTYEIKPKRLSATFEHLIYKVDFEETQLPSISYVLTEEEDSRQLMLQQSDSYALMKRAYKGGRTHNWFVELAVVADYSLFLHFESNISLVEQFVFNTIHTVDSIYGAMDIRIILLTIEIWNEGNPFVIHDKKSVLKDFCVWKKSNFNFRVHHDIAFLFTNQSLGNSTGFVYLATVCKDSFNCGISSYKHSKVGHFAASVVRALGHILGLGQDKEWCTCGQKNCVMSEVISFSTKFSNCSYADWWKMVTKKPCVYNTPNSVDIFTLKSCGNGVVEEGEECDCGSMRRCVKDPCCLSNCTLDPRAECAFGLCCKHCKVMATGELCRQEANACDLPEWCNGTSHQCPEDVYMQNGVPCEGGGYCYEKTCSTHNLQCREIFGEPAKSANEQCYKEVNTRGDRFGNCGMKNSKYVKCNISDILCGRVQCENVREIPPLREHFEVQANSFNSAICWGTDFHLGIAIPDIGVVKNGTECGPNGMCINKKCVDRAALRSHCSTRTCRNRGVCNNKGHCHCNENWAPPYCIIPGNGGSLDSGPPTGKQKKFRKQNKAIRYLVILLLLFVLFYICFYCLSAYLLRKKHKRRRRGFKAYRQEERKANEEPLKPSDRIEEKEEKPSFPSEEIN